MRGKVWYNRGMEDISFISHGYKLSGHLFMASQPKQMAFLLIHCWKGVQNKAAAQTLADLGYTCLTYDLRGHNDSEGTLADFSRADFLADAVVAYDFLRQKVGDNVKIGVIGGSFGSYMAVLLTELRPVACLSLRVPASYPDEGFTAPKLRIPSVKTWEWRNQPLDPNNKAFHALHNFKGEVQIIESENDELVPHQAVQNYADSVPDKSKLQYTVMRGAPHTLTAEKHKEEYVELLTNWAK